MKRKTKEIASTARPKTEKAPLIILKLTEDQEKAIQKLATVDNHKDAAEWAKKQILRILADRSRETR
tara:strand:- start:6990 stop:7190 length:201 start_codon:yes stop_codon:yes gene_type:complete